MAEEICARLRNNRGNQYTTNLNVRGPIGAMRAPTQVSEAMKAAVVQAVMGIDSLPRGAENAVATSREMNMSNPK